MKPNRHAKERAERLRLIRERLHNLESQRAFARLLEVSFNRYQNWEGSGFTIPEEMVKRIKELTPGIDADYILWGDISGLRQDILTRLKKTG